MKGMMAAIELMFNPQASNLGQPQSSCLGRNSTENSSFLECLLGACNGAETMGGDGKLLELGESLLLSSMAKTVVWEAHEDLLKSSQCPESVPGEPGQRAEEGSILEILGALPIDGDLTQGDAIVEEQIVREVGKKSDEGDWNVSKGMSKLRRAPLEGEKPVLSSERADTAYLHAEFREKGIATAVDKKC